MSLYSTSDFRSAWLIGRIEFRHGGLWMGVVDPAAIIPKAYDLFGLLFGVANFARFRPLFADRGLPADCDDDLRVRYEANSGEYFGASWAAFAEITSIDWSARAEGLDERIHEFSLQSDGTERFIGKALPVGLPDRVRDELEKSGSYQHEGFTYRRCRMAREDAKDGTDFDLLVQLMSVLAARFGADNVRLVVFFA